MATIKGIEKLPDNKLTTVNSNGYKIYETAGYNNTSRAFNGLSSAGERQKAGTYFYNLEYNEGGIKKAKTEYLVLKY
ncbi:MAG: gliding motility-associated C-terminal domain-containing protein [Mucilaginibacter sp.]